MFDETFDSLYNFRAVANDKDFQEADDYYLKRFSALATNVERVNMAYVKNRAQTFLKFIKDVKSDEEALRHLDEGIALYQNGNYAKALQYYRKGLATAFTPSVQCYIYASRAFTLKKMNLLKECYLDCDRALECCDSDSLSSTLIYLKYVAEDLAQMMVTGHITVFPEDPRQHLDTNADSCLSIDMSPETRHKKVSKKYHYHLRIPKIVPEKQNKYLECATNRIEMKMDPDYRAHIVTTSPVYLGEMLMVEKPYAHCLFHNDSYHCNGCLELCYNPIPCETCTHAMYCSEECRSAAFESYHKYECTILPTLLSVGCPERNILALRIVIRGRDRFQAICHKTYDQKMFRSESFEELLFLQNDTDDLSTKDLFRLSSIAALMFQLLKFHTQFFQDVANEDLFKTFLVDMLSTVRTNETLIHELSRTEESSPYGRNYFATGIYSSVALFNHSCYPNVEVFFFGQYAVPRVIKNLRKGEACYITYGPQYHENHRRQRQRVLGFRYRFICKCKACTEYYPLFLLMPVAGAIRLHEYNKFLQRFEYLSTHPSRLAASRTMSKIARFVDHTEMFPTSREYIVLWKLFRLCLSILSNRRVL